MKHTGAARPLVPVWMTTHLPAGLTTMRTTRAAHLAITRTRTRKEGRMGVRVPLLEVTTVMIAALTGRDFPPLTFPVVSFCTFSFVFAFLRITLLAFGSKSDPPRAT